MCCCIPWCLDVKSLSKLFVVFVCCCCVLVIGGRGSRVCFNLFQLVLISCKLFLEEIINQAELFFFCNFVWTI